MEIFRTHTSQDVHIVLSFICDEIQCKKYQAIRVIDKSEKKFTFLQNHRIDAVNEPTFHYSNILIYAMNVSC